MDTLLTTAGGRAVLVVVLLAATSLAWWVRARRLGTMRSVGPAAPPVETQLLGALRSAGVTPGARVTFVQLSSEVCTPCRRTASILSRLVDSTPGAVHVELDAAQHPDLVRSLRVLRTPTVLVLDEDGRERGRSSGGMTPVQARAALEIVPGFGDDVAGADPDPGPTRLAPDGPATDATVLHLEETRRA